MQKTIYKLIAIESLEPGRYQPRQNFDQKSLQELAASILAQGLIEPLVIRELTLERYEILAGERRWRAAKMAGLTELACVIGEYNDQQAAAITLIENIQRQDLNLIEEALGYRRLADEFHFQQDEIALLVGKSRSHVANQLRLLTLNEKVKEKIMSAILTFGHARLLVGLSAEQQVFLAEQIEEKGWSVRQLEKKVKELKALPLCKPSTFIDLDRERLQVKLGEQVGAPVEIICTQEGSGWLQVKFFSNETLVGLLERMGLRYD